MQKKTLAQFSLTVICTMVLAACGSSGSSSKPSTAATNTTPPAATTPAATTTQTETPKAETPAVAETPAEETPATAPAVSVLNNDDDHTVATTALDNGDAAKGTKTVTRNKSNVEFLDQPATDFASFTETMKVQNPHPRLDTLTIAETKGVKKDKAVVYLEDLDVSGNIKEGVANLKDIHIVSSKDTAPRNFTTSTKTELKGKDNNGMVLTYHDGRLNYTEYGSEKDDKVAKYDDATKTFTVGAAEAKITDARPRKDTVGELYGHRTHVTPVTDAATAASDDADKVSNLPLVETVIDKQKLVDDGKDFAILKEVQYGRVTSSMNQKKLSDFREGLDIKNPSLETYVGTYGKFGADGTENHYFYRGVNNTTVDELATLKKAGGVLSYVGHAVTYGLDHSNNGFAGADSKAVPTALSVPKEPDYGLISGTHVAAKLNLADDTVEGAAFNKWFNGKEAVDVNLVTFNGKMSTTGNISGTATNKFATGALQDGVFSANLFGAKAEEMGGSAHSVVKGDKAWGLVFGAKQIQEKPAPVPAAPTPGLTNSTNAGKN